jgi:hypothetical protein
MKRAALFALAILIVVGVCWAARERKELSSDYALLRTDMAISRAKSWRMRLESTDPGAPKEWMVVEAIPPDREHGWQHVDRSVGGDGRITGDLEYVRIGDDRYFRGDALFGHQGSSVWIKLIPRDFPPLDGFFDLRLHMSNPRTIGYSFDSVETSWWSNYRGVKMVPQGVRSYSGHACSESGYTWTIEETGRVMKDSVCIGVFDHLPYRLTTSGGFYEVSYEWNPRISVVAPSPVSARPKGFITALPNI